MTEPTPAGDVGREGSMDLAAFDGHTPGPWRHRLPHADGLYVVGTDLRQVATVHRLRAPEDARNARLIAAAPTLLAEIRALREERDALREALEYALESYSETAALLKILDVARRALTPHPPAHPNPAGTTEDGR